MSVEQLRANAAAAERIAKERNEIITAMAKEAARKAKELEELNAAIAQAQQSTTAGAPASVPAAAPSVNNSVWPLPGAASAAIVAPVIAAAATRSTQRMSSTAITDVGPDVNPNAELYRDYQKKFREMQVPEIKVAFATGIVTITFSLGYLPVDAEKMWKRMHGIRPNAKPTQKGFVYTVTMTVEAASRYGKTSAEIEAAFLAHLALAFSRRAKNGNTQTYSVTAEYMSYFAPNLELTDEEKKFCTTEHRMRNTYRFIQEYLAKRNGTTPRQPRTTTGGGGGGGGGGAAMPTGVNDTRSAKVNALPEEKTEEFAPTKELERRIKNSMRPIVGGPLNDPAGHEHLQTALKENNIAYSSTSGTFSSPNLTAAQIEEILCKVFSLQTTAEIAEAKRKARTGEFKEKQAEAAASTQIGAIPEGAESEDEDESDDEADDGNEAGGGSKDDDESDEVTVYKLPRNVVYTLQQVCDSGKDIAGIYSKVAAEFAIVFSENEYHAKNGQDLSTTTCNEIAGNVAILAIKLMYM
jgi:hypothetical protein